MKDCLFCKINEGIIPSKKIYEDNLVNVIMDVNPISNGHMLIIPKKHYTDYTELDNEIILHINDIAKKMQQLIFERLNTDGVRFIVNFGSAQEIKHFHFHVIPIYKSNKKIADIESIYQLLK